jgi:hypothetical protein
MASKKSRSLKKQMTFATSHVLFFILLFAVVGAYALVQSFAAPPLGKGGGKPFKGGANGLSYSVVTDANGDGLANYNDVIRFSITTTATQEPHVNLSCTQNGTVVYQAQAGYFDSYPWPWSQNMTLSSGAWTGGEADCTAKWYYFNGSKTVDSGVLSFHVNS